VTKLAVLLVLLPVQEIQLGLTRQLEAGILVLCYLDVPNMLLVEVPDHLVEV
jgi:hypothetical protein